MNKLEKIIRKLLKYPKHQTYKKQIAEGLLSVGRYSYGVPTIEQYAGSESKVTIGSFCSISNEVKIIAGGIHPKDWVSLFPFRSYFNLGGAYQDGMPFSNGEVVIGNDVWIGSNVIIMSGVTIGDGAIIAAGSIITKDVLPYSIVMGIPGKNQGFRIPEKDIEFMLKIKWWNWEMEKILAEVELLSSTNLNDFISKFK
jgi:acetyltransferase-like isoleucine patch superfamily enzyme